MTKIEVRILENQMEILWALSYLVAKMGPDLVGRHGELDKIRDDLAQAAKKTSTMIEVH